MRLTRFFLVLFLFVLASSSVRAEYIVLRNGQRLHVTGYQLQGDTYHLQIAGGSVDIPADEVVSIEPEEIFRTPPPPPVPPANGPFQDLIRASASRYKIDADLVSSVIAAESNFNPKAVSRKNARGLMQLVPATAARLGVRNSFDPQQNIDAGTRYLSNLLQRYNYDLTLALAAYNAGPTRVEQYHSVPPFAETQSYVRRVKKNYDQRKTTSASNAPAISLFDQPNLFTPTPTTSTVQPLSNPSTVPPLDNPQPVSNP